MTEKVHRVTLTESEISALIAMLDTQSNQLSLLSKLRKLQILSESGLSNPVYSKRTLEEREQDKKYSLASMGLEEISPLKDNPTEEDFDIMQENLLKQMSDSIPVDLNADTKESEYLK